MKRILFSQNIIGFYVGVVVLMRGLEGSCSEPIDTHFIRDWGKHKKKSDSAEGSVLILVHLE
jgi:hypothetical protein